MALTAEDRVAIEDLINLHGHLTDRAISTGPVPGSPGRR